MDSVRMETRFQAADSLTPELAAKIANCASSFSSKLSIEINGRVTRLESLISILSVELYRGHKLTVHAVGPDCDTAAQSLLKLLA